MILVLLLVAHIAHFSDASVLLTKDYKSEKLRAQQTATESVRLHRQAQDRKQEAKQHLAASKKEEEARARDIEAAKKAKKAETKLQRKDEKNEMEADDEMQDAKYFAERAAIQSADAENAEAAADKAEAEATGYEEEAAADAAEEEEDAEAVAAVEWIPFVDVVADVAGGAAAAALAADAAESEALAAEEGGVAAEETDEVEEAEALGARFRKKRLAKSRAAEALKSAGRVIKEAAFAQGLLATKAYGDAELAKSAAKKAKRQAENEAEAAGRFRKKAENQNQTSQEESQKAAKDRKEAAEKGTKAMELLWVASLSAVLLLLSNSPVGYSARDFSLASSGLQDSLLGSLTPKDPRQSSRYKKQMWVLECITFALSFLLAANIFCSQVSLEPNDHNPVGVWCAFCWAVLSVALVVLIKGVCVGIWAAADLRPARICAQHCLSGADRQALLRDSLISECLLAANSCTAWGVLCMFAYVALRDLFSKTFGMLPVAGFSNLPVLWAIIAMACMRVFCGLLSCPCACNVQPDARELGCLEHAWHSSQWWCKALVPVLIMALCFKTFHPVLTTLQTVVKQEHLVPQGVFPWKISALLVFSIIVDVIVYGWLLFLKPRAALVHEIMPREHWTLQIPNEPPLRVASA